MNFSFPRFFSQLTVSLPFIRLKNETYNPFPGADDYNFVHANPNWSPDEKFIVFSRAKTKNEVHEDITHVVPLSSKMKTSMPESRIQHSIRSLSIPLTKGKGGHPEPIEGASQNNVTAIIFLDTRRMGNGLCIPEAKQESCFSRIANCSSFPARAVSREK
jgi:hypothetical protein